MSLKIKQLLHSWWPSGEKTAGGKMQDSFIMLLKTHGEKMSVFRLAKMLLK
jgi:hypothetical protein